jgi:co-chaperonin GroES (HSP10)
VREAGGEIGDKPMLEGVAAVEDAVRVMSLAGDTVLVSKFAGDEIVFDEGLIPTKYLILNEYDIMAKLL